MSSKKITAVAPLQGALAWIDRYVYQVGERLPIKLRRDIEMEVRSLLLDEVDQLPTNGTPTEAQVLEVLRRYPSPAQMAKRYGAPQALIGPKYYDSYVTVATLVATIVMIVSVIAIVASVVTGASGISILGTIGSLLSSVLTALGIVTVIFALVERYADPEDWQEPEPDATWNPASLPEVEQRNKISISDIFTSVVTSLVAILWLRFYVADDGTIAIFAGEWGRIQVFNETFLAFIPWIIAAWTAELLFTIIAGAQRHWTTLTRTLVMLSSAAGVAIGVIMLNAGPLAVPAYLEPWIRISIVVAIIVSLIDIARHLWAIFKTETNRPARLATAP